jgi:hypothetical protein
MTLSLVLLIPVLVLAVVAVFAFAGCASFDAAETPAPPPTTTTPPVTPPVTTPPPVVTPPAALTYPQVIMAEPGLRCYWRLNEVAGAVTAADIEPKQPQSGTYVDTLQGLGGALALGTMPTDTAVYFDGASSHVEVPWHEQVNPGLNFSVEAWVRPEPNTNSSNTIVGSYNPQSFQGFALELIRGTGGVITLRGRIGVGDKFIPLDVGFGDGTVNDGWRHVVMTYESVGTKLKLWVNAGTTQFTSELPPPATPFTYIPVQGPTGPSFRIGAGRLTPANTPARLVFRGRIDEVALYDRALDKTAIDNHYAVATTP